VGIEMCGKCRKGISCEEYRRYKEPFLFQEMDKPLVKTRRRVLRKRNETETAVKDRGQEQLALCIDPNSSAGRKPLR
jgi:hypothetical protein